MIVLEVLSEALQGSILHHDEALTVLTSAAAVPEIFPAPCPNPRVRLSSFCLAFDGMPHNMLKNVQQRSV